MLASLLLIGILCMTEERFVRAECSREQSRLVRNLILKHITPIYKEYEVEIPKKCPWNMQRDLFGIQEEHKYEESATRWVCEFCGKAFFEERFLDLHFINRHPEHVRKDPSAQCFADQCDNFRCDVIRRRNKPEYWDVALCKEPDLQRKRERCQETLAACTPTSLNGTGSEFTKALSSKVCDYLTCARYWELLEHESAPLILAGYLMGTVMLSVFLFIYYYLAYTHFYTDDSIFEPTKCLREKHRYQPFFFPQGRPVRKRSKSTK